jgi:hypothetical protein|tara:strand:- start:52 stop:492 length:441 start_codon:yes stop_codon:yes gene_type:complete
MSSGETTQKELKGIGGWLILHTIGFPLMIIGTLFGDYYVFTTVIPTMEEEMASIFTVLLMTDMIFVCYVGYLAFLFFNKDYRFPKQIKIFYIVAIVYEVFELYMFSGYGSVLSVYNYLIGGIIAAAIWIPYFNKSIRVKNTFIGNN